MTLKKQIQKDKKDAMINRETEKRNVLTTLLGELDRISKNPTNSEVISVIKKMVDNNILTKNEHENKYLDIYVPKVMPEDEIKSIIKAYINEHNLTGPKSIGLVMKFLKDNYTGQYNGKIASKITKKELI